MMAPDFVFYMHFKLNTELVKRKGVSYERRYPKYDLDAVSGCWSGLEKLLNRNGTMSISILPTAQNANYKQESTTPNRQLSMSVPGMKSSYNLTGLKTLITSNESGKLFSCGYPSKCPQLRNGDANPLFEERHDGFIVVEANFDEVTHQAHTMEIFVISRYAGLVIDHLAAANSGLYNSQMAAMRQNAKPYGGGI